MNTLYSDVFNSQPTGVPGQAHALAMDPFLDQASMVMPKDMQTIFRLCEHIWLTCGPYKTAMQRIVRYFLTKIEFMGDVSDREKKRYQEFLDETLHIYDLLAQVGDDFLAYGNSFTTLYVPFNRVIICDECNFSRNLDNVKKFKFGMDTLKFTTTCPRCKKETLHSHKDLRSLDEKKINVVRWNLHELIMMHSFISGESEVLWQINPDVKKQIKQSNTFWMRHTPWEVIEAIKVNKLFRFNKESIYHMREPTLAGVINRGWGIPRMLGTFREVYYVQVLKRYNEAIATDYIVPFRVISPEKGTAPDPAMNYDLSEWSSTLQTMISRHRADPTGWHTSPFPVKYQSLSGEGVELSPFQLIKQGQSDMMDAIGVPIELFQGTIQLQAAPTALRLFQSTWPQLIAALNGFLNWILSRLSVIFGWEPITARLQPVTYADDMDRKNMLINLAAAQQISKSTAFAFLGVDPAEERKRILNEQKADYKAQQEFSEDIKNEAAMDETLANMQSAGLAGPQAMLGAGGSQDLLTASGGQGQVGAAQPPVTNMQNAPQGNVPMSPQDVMEKAKDLAQQLMSTDPTTRKNQMVQLKHSNPMLHAAVKQMMTDATQQAASQGVAQMRQSMGGS